YRAPGDMLIPLPAGATSVDLDSESPGVLRDASVEVTRPLPPGEIRLLVGFELPAKAGEVPFALDLPFGSDGSIIAFDDEPGLAIDHLPSGVHMEARTANGRTYQVISDISAAPNESLAMTVHLPHPRPDVSLLHACRRAGAQPTALVGQTLDFTLN